MLTQPLTPDRLKQLLATYERGRHRRLLVRAHGLDLEVEPDAISGGHAVRSPRRRGYVEIVTEQGCTCEEFHALGSCPHAALVAAQREEQAA